MIYPGDNWSTYQLTEFLGAVATLRRADDVVGSAVQRIAEAVDSEVGAFVGSAGIVSSIGFPFGRAPRDTLEDAIALGSGALELPGVGRCQSLVAPIEDAELTSLLLARLGDDPFTRDEINLVDGMIRVLELVLQNLRAFETERTMLADLLAGAEERAELEDQLRQAQKMEAVGQLAGGIAHDFNNLLMVILGYSTFVAEALGETDPLVDSVHEITGAAERAAALTQQLLAFSRKEVVRPQTIDLNEAVPGLLKLLRRMLRESIEFELELAPRVQSTNIDRGQLEQVIVNLAVNAGDAMPAGGTLRVGTENRSLDEDDARLHGGLAAGEYVVLSVTDTGAGMPAEVVARAFEPFYTTKPRGSGTGLGLATVYGIVAQAGGHVELRSAPASGTTATVYLPVATASIEETPESAAPAHSAPRSGTVLVVEDEDTVRTLVQRILERNGYRVLAAASGCEALQLAQLHLDEVEVVLTDVVMPGMSGRDFVDRVTAVAPHLKVVFMSGYPDEIAADLGVLGPETNYLQKPFTEADVLAALDPVRRTEPAPAG